MSRYVPLAAIKPQTCRILLGFRARLRQRKYFALMVYRWYSMTTSYGLYGSKTK
jgi:hypothetical protein